MKTIILLFLATSVSAGEIVVNNGMSLPASDARYVLRNPYYDGSQSVTVASATVTGSSFSVGTSTLVVTGGKVGIGITPTYPLDVVGITYGMAEGAGILNVRSNTAFGANRGGSMAFMGQDGVATDRTFGIIGGRKENETSGNYDSYLHFGTRVNGGAITEKMRITSAGNVGIGGTSPENKLHVFVDGTTSAVAPVSYAGIVAESGNSNSAINIIGGSGAVSTIEFGDENDNDVGRIRYNHGDDSMQFFSSAAVRMAITGTGNVGIGTTAPTQKLSVSSSTASSFFFSIGGAMTKAEILAYDPVKAGEMFFCTDCSSAALCISTGTAVADMADIGDRTVACQ